MTLQSHNFTDRLPFTADPIRMRRLAPAGTLSRRELRRIIAEQLD